VDEPDGCEIKEGGVAAEKIEAGLVAGGRLQQLTNSSLTLNRPLAFYQEYNSSLLCLAITLKCSSRVNSGMRW